ncbi:MAG TPA: Ig-like domain-containing protein [Burkholderiales bacterium]|jgi:RHS repeat-associated protein
MNGSNVGAATFNSSTGKWTKNVGISPGTYFITATAADSNGNTAVSAQITVIVTSHVSTVPGWGYDTWGGTYTFGGSCPGGQTHSLSGSSISDAGNNVIAFSRTCASATYNNPTCTVPTITSPVGMAGSFCTFTGTFPGSFSLSIICAPGKSLTAASPTACVSWPVATVTLTPPSGAPFIAPARLALTASATNANGSLTWLSFEKNGTDFGAATYNATTGKWNATFNNVAAGTYVLTAIGGDEAGHTTASSPFTVTVYPSLPPSVSITSPADNRSFVPGEPIHLAASAGDTDGTIAQVQFFSDAVLIGTGALDTGTATSGSYVLNWTGAPVGTHAITATATDNSGGAVTTNLVTVNVSATGALTIAVNPPPSGASYTAPASIPLTAVVSSGVAVTNSVRFFSNGVSVGTGELVSGTSTGGAYVTNTWTNVPQGTYAITASATDDNGYTVVSSPVSFTVGAASTGANVGMYFVAPDQVGTPRLVEDQNQQTVWSWQQGEPFGDSQPNQQPASAGAFVLNLAFPGQFRDQETNTNYNYFRDYDPAIGRYSRSDPIGLNGGINTYSYTSANPLTYIDPRGLAKGDNHFGIDDPGFWKWWEVEKYGWGPFDDRPGYNPDKPYDIPNNDVAQAMKHEYDNFCKASENGRPGSKEREKIKRRLDLEEPDAPLKAAGDLMKERGIFNDYLLLAAYQV